MIEPRELRIGNYVSFTSDSESEPWEVVGISPYGSSFVIRGEKYVGGECLCIYDLYDRINPIPLTEDILMKCGMKIVDAGDYKTTCIKCGVLILFADSSNNFTTLEDCSNQYCISYLHDFQNLFYDLTKTELNVQL